jgi:ribokinase
VAEVFVVGSINQDFVLKVERRPEPGETVTDALLSKGNGGKGANQAAAAALLGASVVFLGRVGGDGFGERWYGRSRRRAWIRASSERPRMPRRAPLL